MGDVRPILFIMRDQLRFDHIRVQQGSAEMAGICIV
jgi:hypothetical protein